MKTAGLEGDVRVAGPVPKPPKISAVDNEVGDHLKRAIPQNYDYDPQAMKPLAKMLWALSVSLGHAMTAHRQFTKLKSATISPDGLIGGRGYVMSVKDVRKALHEACEAISAVSDTVHDELHAPHWRPKLAELEKNDLESLERLVGDAERILEDPEGTTSDDEPEDMEKAEQSGPRADLEAGGDSEAGGSEMPDGDDLADSKPDLSQPKQASSYAYRRANSSLPVETMPGPRVDHLDRGDVDQTGPFGSYNSDEPMSLSDSWSRNDGGRAPGEYDYESEWDNELLDKTAQVLTVERVAARFAASMVPDSITDNTPTQGYDFGIGMGDGNDAHGQGVGDYGTVDSDGKGVYSPSSEMPDDPSGKLHDDETSDTTPMVELSVGQSSMPKHATWKTGSKLPNDDEPPVARSDYYEGDKGNVVNSSELPGTAIPAKPTSVTPRPAHLGEHMFSTSTLPQDPVVETEFAKDVQPGTGYRFERSNQPYIKWDSHTKNMRPDYVYQREVEGPYVKQASAKQQEG